MAWWIQKTSEDHMKVMVEVISAAAKVRLRQESGRRGGIEGGLEGRSTVRK